MKLYFYFFLFALTPSISNYAQLDSSSIITEDLLDNILVEPEEESNAEELVDILEDLINNPIDINKADLIELFKIPGMDIQSAQKIIEHRNKFGIYYSTSELYSIRELDKQLIKNILPFLKTLNPDDIDPAMPDDKIIKSSNAFLEYSRLKIRSRFTNDLQKRDGFLSGKYQGSKLKLYNRFLYNYDNNYQVGYSY